MYIKNYCNHESSRVITATVIKNLMYKSLLGHICNSQCILLLLAGTYLLLLMYKSCGPYCC
jgi:hypothetical protein